MTNEEALEVLELHLSVSHSKSEREAVQIAIEALKEYDERRNND